MNYSGPNLYVGQSCYLKLANYHTPLGVPISVIHSRVVRGTTQADVQIGSGGTPPPTVPVPNVVGQTQATATSAITGAGLTRGAVAHQSSSLVASGSVISESPAAGADVVRGSAVNLVVSTGGGITSGGGGGGGGGGAFDAFTLAALLSYLMGGLWRARRSRSLASTLTSALSARR
ncbi:MAG: PASTA domain-containing protein [Gammaproteobacteria bacterium]|nr:MAG: PASTA domain-containing protein [Gammaproteobacteria bacterium]